VTGMALNPNDLSDLADLLELICALCDHEYERVAAALDHHTAYGYGIGELRADTLRLARRLERTIR